MKYLFSILIIIPISCFSQTPIPEGEFSFDQTLEESISGILPDTSNCIFSYAEDRFGNNNALDFSQGYLDYGNPSFSAMDTSDFSISCWILPPTGSGNGTVTYLQKTDTANIGLGGSYTILYSHFSSSISFGINFEDSTGTTLATPPLPNDWLHLAITVDRSDSARIYINGDLLYQSDISASAGVPCQRPDERLILASWILNQNARIDDLLFYKEVLAVSEINDLYNAPNSASIIEYENTPEFSIFPNPTNGQDLNVFTEKSGNYELTNLAGKTILKGSLLEGENSINVSNLTSGVYLLKMNYGNNNVISKKVILQK